MKSPFFIALITIFLVGCEEDPDPPIISIFSPTIAPVGAMVTVEGKNFSSGAIVTIGGKQASTTIISESKLTFKVPFNLSKGDYQISVTVGTTTGSSQSNFTVTPSPKILYTLPIKGGTGTKVSIYGDYFDQIKENNIVRFNGVKVLVEEIYAGFIVVRVPNEARTGKITLEINGIIVESPVDFEILPWERLPDLTSQGKRGSIFYAFNNKIYIAGGSYIFLDTYVSNSSWQYDLATNTWSSSNFVALSSKEIRGVGIDHLNFILDPTQVVYNFYQFDFLTNEFKSLSPFPGVYRHGIIFFSAKSKIYAGLGFDPINKVELNDIWSYDIAENKWNSELSFPGTGFFNAKVFVISNKIFIGNGYHYDTSIDAFVSTSEFWSYNLELTGWKQVADVPGTAGGTMSYPYITYYPSGLSIGTSGYLNFSNLLFEYNSVTNQWKRKASVPTAFYRFENVFFTYDGKIYLGMGGSYPPNQGSWNMVKDMITIDDFWRYDPSKDQ